MSTFYSASGGSPPALSAPQMAWSQWRRMPEFIQPNHKPVHTVKVFLTKQPPPACKKSNPGFTPFVTVQFNRHDFAKHLSEVAEKVNKTIFSDTKEITLETDEAGLAVLLFGGKHKIGHHSCWFPWQPDTHHRRYVYRQSVAGAVVNPFSPVFVISKGRWENPLTARALERMGCPYSIVVEPDEQKAYEYAFAKGYDGGKPYKHGTIHVAPENFSRRACGSIPVRNYVWDLAIKTGKDRHFLLDDNIPAFLRLHHNLHIPVETGAIFRAMENFVDRYENIAFAGLQNNQFVDAKYAWPPFELNTKVYSCTLIRNDLRLTDGLTKKEIKDSKGRWRGVLNEDTDLILRALKRGWCTVCFVTFNSDKVGTMTMKGGNDEIYADDGRLLMAQSLHVQHPDVTYVSWRHSRWNHVANYNKAARIGGNPVLKLRKGVVVPEGTNNFGMACFDRASGERVPELD